MADSTSDYLRAYESAKRELAELIVAQEQGQRKMLVLRKSMDALSALCESGGVEVGASVQANYLNSHFSLPDEVRMLLQASYPLFERPNTIMEQVKQLGRDLSKYDNPQAAIQTILQRMVSSEEAEEATNREGKKAYRMAPLSVKAATDSLGVVAPCEKIGVGTLMQKASSSKNAAPMSGGVKSGRNNP
jgi:hypothetical protein